MLLVFLTSLKTRLLQRVVKILQHRIFAMPARTIEVNGHHVVLLDSPSLKSFLEAGHRILDMLYPEIRL